MYFITQRHENSKAKHKIQFARLEHPTIESYIQRLQKWLKSNFPSGSDSEKELQALCSQYACCEHIGQEVLSRQNARVFEAGYGQRLFCYYLLSFYPHIRIKCMNSRLQTFASPQMQSASPTSGVEPSGSTMCFPVAASRARSSRLKGIHACWRTAGHLTRPRPTRQPSLSTGITTSNRRAMNRSGTHRPSSPPFARAPSTPEAPPMTRDRS